MASSVADPLSGDSPFFSKALPLMALESIYNSWYVLSGKKVPISKL